MKKIVLTLSMLLIMHILTFGQSSKKDFRDFTWGSSLAQVKTNETANFISQDKDDLLTYTDQLAGMDVEFNYQFNDNGKLISGDYVFTKKFSNPQLYIQDFDIFKDLLTTKYGKPRLYKEEWSANKTPGEKDNFGQAIADGNLSIYSIWTTDRSSIKLILSMDNNRPSLQIHYTARSLDELENKALLQSALPKL